MYMLLIHNSIADWVVPKSLTATPFKDDKEARKRPYDKGDEGEEPRYLYHR